MKKDTLIFVADDDRIILTAITRYLHKKGFTNIKSFTNKQDSLLSLVQEQPQLCIIDYLLGEENGWELCKEIQHIVPTATMVLLSGQDDVRLTFQFIREGLRHYIAKDETMFDTLDEILQQLCFYNTHN
ncbi:two-component system, OmpR family, phosphate regulon response regulator PhoB [Flexibacter flexilis DSM 6793]|uniref:Two-component system, OmpR family, phosphate regulon response regulator PhoB n=1 Tax=Flexibacter flexilis DSM 6793 TaxID=927664 RepID=A0A1I1DGW4_9BACT|nr:response regulator [Flexibacter flexilis]SFB71783.1 two-component system, OmpR family, phosphate regulon response regulator PhoB [Flexibacter flexilis DSM 6793]